MGAVDPAESFLGFPLGLAFASRIEFDGILADLADLAVFAEDILHESDDEAWHAQPPVHKQV